MALIFALSAFAEDKVKDFTIKTIDGETIAYSDAEVRRYRPFR
jgi:hypothetical protein